MRWQPLECICVFQMDTWEDPKEFLAIRSCDIHKEHDARSVFESYKAAFTAKREVLVALEELAESDPSMKEVNEKGDVLLKPELTDLPLKISIDGSVALEVKREIADLVQDKVIK